MTFPKLVKLASTLPLILGSGSPRRLQLLEETGVPFSQLIPDIHEGQLVGEDPYHYARRLAEEKALEISSHIDSDSIVLGCDTIVVLEGQVLGKPTDEGEAFDILSRLSGKRHVVCSAAAFARGRIVLATGYDLTNVLFNSVSSGEIRDYIATGEPMDKAGAYGIQGMGSFLVDRIEGNLDTVVGLPRALLERLAGEVLSLI